MTVTRKITVPQQKALDWLKGQGGNRLIGADGKLGNWKRDVWIALRDAGRVTIALGKVQVIQHGD